MLHDLWHMMGGDQARFFPTSSSTEAHQLDSLTIYLLSISTFFVAVIFFCLITFLIKYRRRPGNEVARHVEDNYKLEATWAAIPLVVALIAFAWGAKQFLQLTTVPSNAEAISIVGKQWMWKSEHTNGVSEINDLHVPVGRSIQLLMISQDVIHSYYIPDFRVKYDVLPGRYSRVWFRPDRVGEFHLACTQYCGTDHSEMVGTVTVMSETDYQNWLTLMKDKNPLTATPAEKGEKLFASHGCISCHDNDAHDDHDGQAQTSIGPSLKGIYGSLISVRSGDRKTLAVGDDNYLRESILDPHAKIVVGYQDVMPTYAGQFKEDEIVDLIQYLRALRDKGVSRND